jgi:hypothetical protein
MTPTMTYTSQQLVLALFDSNYYFFIADTFQTLGYSNGMAFTTYDSDNDLYSSNCANSGSGWWHRSCFRVNLNGIYGTPGQFNSGYGFVLGIVHSGFNWWLGFETSVMMIRRV